MKEELRNVQFDGNNNEKKVQNEYFYLAYKPNEFYIAWDWRYPVYARVGFMHNDLYHPYIEYIKKTARKHEMRIFHISTGDLKEENHDSDVFHLLDYELTATEEGLTHLEEYRMKWVQLYLKLICYLNDRERINFIPQMKYFPNEEGPLAGYLRSIDKMNNQEDKKLILSHIEKLREVKWYFRYNENQDITDFIYQVNGNTFKEKLESLFIGAWTIANIHYAREFTDKNMESMLTLLQFSEDFINMSLDQTSRFIIEELVNLLAALTLPTLDNLYVEQRHALFIQSPMLFPNVYPSLSHMLYGVEKVPDFDLHSLVPDLKPFEPNEVLYRSKVVTGTEEEFVKKVKIDIES